MSLLCRRGNEPDGQVRGLFTSDQLITAASVCADSFKTETTNKGRSRKLCPHRCLRSLQRCLFGPDGVGVQSQDTEQRRTEDAGTRPRPHPLVSSRCLSGVSPLASVDECERLIRSSEMKLQRRSPAFYPRPLPLIRPLSAASSSEVLEVRLKMETAPPSASVLEASGEGGAFDM